MLFSSILDDWQAIPNSQGEVFESDFVDVISRG
jgi:hypothetical protein